MTLKPFKQKLLKFIYTLTRCDFFPNDNQLARRMKVTRKTIHNWLRYLGEPYSYKEFYAERKLSYYPAIKKDMLGLQFVSVLFYNAKKELAFLWPNKNYVGSLFDFTDGEFVLVVEYVVPKSQVEEFKKLLLIVKEMNLCSEFRVLETSPSFAMYAPFHKVIDETGKFHYDKADLSSIRNDQKRLRSFFESIEKAKPSSLIRKNPLIVPVIAEHQYERRKSIQVWNAIKRKLGDDIWDYIPSVQKQTDGVGIQAVQNAVKALSESEVFTQMRIVYFPLQFRGFCFWMILEFEELENLIDLAGKWLQYSHSLNIFRIGKQKALITSVLNGESLQGLFNVLSRVTLHRTMIFNMKRGLELITSSKHSVFDYSRIFSPKHCKWSLDIQEMEREIESTAV